MNTSKTGGIEAENIRSLLDQLTYFVIELEAQLPFLTRIAPEILSASSHEGAKPIRSYYEDFLQREASLRSQLKELFNSTKSVQLGEQSKSQDWEIEGLVRRVINARKESVEIILGMEENNWRQLINVDATEITFRSWIYGIVLEEADLLREIGILFSEQQLSFTR